MGKPVWLLLHSTPDWRWQSERADNPWYPTIQLFRLAPSEWLERAYLEKTDREQDSRTPIPDDMGWQPLIKRVAKALRAFRRKNNA